MLRTRWFIFRATVFRTVAAWYVLHANDISSLVGGRVCSVDTLYYTSIYNRLPEDEPSGSKHAEDNVKIKILV